VPTSVTRLQERTSTTEVEYEGEVVKLVYRQGHCTPYWYDGLGERMPRRLVAEVLSTWDVETAPGSGEIYEPIALSDPRWITLVREVAVERAKAERDAAIAAGAAATPATTPRGKKADAQPPTPLEPLTEAEIDSIRAAEPTPEAVNELYVNGWEAMLMVLPQPFIAAVLDAILEDVRPGKSRR